MPLFYVGGICKLAKEYVVDQTQNCGLSRLLHRTLLSSTYSKHKFYFLTLESLQEEQGRI